MLRKLWGFQALSKYSKHIDHPLVFKGTIDRKNDTKQGTRVITGLAKNRLTAFCRYFFPDREYPLFI